MKHRNVAIALTLSIAAAAGVTLDAEAAATTRNVCSVLAVQVDGSASTKSRLVLDTQCSEGRMTLYGYYGYACTPAGVNVSPPTIEGWRSLAQTSLLSGKKVNITYDNATGGGCSNAIYAINLY